MQSKALTLTILAGVQWIVGSSALAYPPAVGILGKAKNCLVCHADNGGWKNNADLIIDIVDKATGQSLRQPDGVFKLSLKRGEPATVMTVIGYRGSSSELVPYRNAWLYVAPETIGSSSLSKFLPGWEVNLPMACRIVGDNSDLHPAANLTALPMTIRPGDAARNGSVTLQVMLTRGESVKGKPKEGMLGKYFERVLQLEVRE